MSLRLIRRSVLLVLFALTMAVTIVLLRSTDPYYSLQELVFYLRFHRYDAAITEVAAKHNIDPMLVKAIVWRESRFHPEKVGASGERGLMQLMPAAAADWARSQKVESFRLPDLHAPKTNLQAGTWYLKQSMQRWSQRQDPEAFALAEYNAGKKRVDRWIRESNIGPESSTEDFIKGISFPGTRNYVKTVLQRYRFYKERGRM